MIRMDCVGFGRFITRKTLYTKELKLKRGEYEYKFVVDGKWTMDNDNPRFTANDFGTLNSIFEI